MIAFLALVVLVACERRATWIRLEISTDAELRAIAFVAAQGDLDGGGGLRPDGSIRVFDDGGPLHEPPWVLVFYPERSVLEPLAVEVRGELRDGGGPVRTRVVVSYREEGEQAIGVFLARECGEARVQQCERMRGGRGEPLTCRQGGQCVSVFTDYGALPTGDATVGPGRDASVAPLDTAGEATAVDEGATDAPPRQDADAFGAGDASHDIADAAAFDAPGDASRDVPVADSPADAYEAPVCGEVGQPCCGGSAGDVACRAGLVCDAFENGHCVAATSPEPLECSATSACTGGRVCQGAGYCGTRACMRCAFPGALAFDAMCDPRMAGINCATGVCVTGRCSWACAPGAAGDAECGRRAPGTRCREALYGINIVSMRPTAWVTLGNCEPTCNRNADCATGRACAAAPNLLDDRVDLYCVGEGRMPSGATCTSGEMCQSYLCLQIPGVGRRCTTPCVSDADCPAAQRCGDIVTLRPTSGADQPSRGCLPR